MGNSVAPEAVHVATFQPSFGRTKSETKRKQIAEEQLGTFLASNLKTRYYKQKKERKNKDATDVKDAKDDAPTDGSTVSSIFSLVNVPTSLKSVTGYYAVRPDDFERIIQNGFRENETFDVLLRNATPGTFLLMCHFRVSKIATQKKVSKLGTQGQDAILDSANYTVQVAKPTCVSIFGYIKVEPGYSFHIFMYDDPENKAIVPWEVKVRKQQEQDEEQNLMNPSESS